MKILVAGATGALGTALIPRLVGAGHEVVGLSRGTGAARRLESLGATPAVGDLLVPADLRTTMASANPEIVIHAAKAIPKRGPIFHRDMHQTNRLHDQGTRNLLQAAVHVGSRRILVESIVFAYGYGDLGDDVITEEHATKSQVPHPALEALIDSVLAMENTVLDADRAGRIEATVLRCGLFYGPMAGTEVMARMLRRRALPLPGRGSARWPLANIEDVADAFVLAATSPEHGKTFNIVDNEPVPLRTFLEEVARHAGAPRPWSLPHPLAKALAPYFTEVAMTSMKVSNERARSELGWRPAYSSYREGLAAWAADAAVGHTK